MLAASRCRDCDSDLGKPWLDEHGLWHVSVGHDPTCPGWLGLTPLVGLIVHLPARRAS